MFDQYYKEQIQYDNNNDYQLNPNYYNIIDKKNKINNNQIENEEEKIKDNIKPIQRQEKEINQPKD